MILVTAFGTVNDAVEAMKLGAADYVLKPLNADELKVNVRRALEGQELVSENRNLRELAANCPVREHHRAIAQDAEGT